VKPFTAATGTAALLAAALLAIPVAWFYGRTTSTGDGRESFTDKHEWSIMQLLHARRGTDPISGLEFSQHEDYRIVSLPAVTGERIFIMLNPQSAPYYKQMPHTDYELSEDQYLQIVRTQKPTSTVDECLSSHIRRTP
jgi:hypothetical protein